MTKLSGTHQAWPRHQYVSQSLERRALWWVLRRQRTRLGRVPCTTWWIVDRFSDRRRRHAVGPRLSSAARSGDRDVDKPLPDTGRLRAASTVCHLVRLQTRVKTASILYSYNTQYALSHLAVLMAHTSCLFHLLLPRDIILRRNIRLSVRPSVCFNLCRVSVFCWNEQTYSQTFLTFWYSTILVIPHEILRRNSDDFPLTGASNAVEVS